MRYTFVSVARITLFVLVISLSGLGVPAAFAALKVWSAAPADGNWNNTSNWAGGVVPVSGDDVAFPATSTIQVTSNNISSLNLNTITFTGNGYTINGNALTLGGYTCSTGNAPQTNLIGVNVTLGSDFVASTANGCQVTMSGAIDGAHNFNKTSPGTLILSGSNSYTGVTVVGAGTLIGQSSAAFGTADGTSGTQTLVVSGAVVRIDGVTMGNEMLNLSGTGSGFGALIGNGTAGWNGPIVLAGSSSVTANGGTLTLAGSITGAGSNLTITGGGTVVVAGTGTYTGGTTVTNGGRLQLDGTLSGTTLVSVSGATSLSGVGTIVAPVTTASASAILPGHSPGILTTGNLTLNSNTNVFIEMAGTTVGSQYDQFNVVGAASIGGSNLIPSISFGAAPGTQFTILNNDGVDPITGTFNGLAEGSSFVANGTTFSISYVGGSGNDVVLTVLQSVPTMPPAMWLGLGALLLAVAAGTLVRNRGQRLA